MTTARRSDTLRDQNSVPIPGALLSVIDYAGNAAVLKNDDASNLTNPFETDAFGGYVYNTTPGRYTERFTYGGRIVADDRDVVVGTIIAAVDPSPANAGKFVALDGAGVPTFASGTGNDSAFRTDAAASSGASLVGFVHSATGATALSVQSVLRGLTLTPEMFGGTSYASSTTALSGTDSTAAIQAMANAAASVGLPVTGNGRWYKVSSTVSWPSHTRGSDLRLAVANSTTDVWPFAVDGRSGAPKTDIIFTRCEVDGNRIGQTSLTTSGGDGQRHGFVLIGDAQNSVTNVTLDQCKAWNCATDGFWTWCNGATQGTGTAYFFTGILLRDCDFQFNGRHGASAMGVKGITHRGGFYKNNGKDAQGYPAAPYTSGGNGRTNNGQLNGAKYGRPIDLESSLLGEGYEDVTIDGIDGRDNIGGLLFQHVMRGTPAKNIVVRNSQFDNVGGTQSDGALVVYAATSGGSAYGSADAFIGVKLLNNIYGANLLNVSSTTNLEVRGGTVNITTASAYGATISNCSNVSYFDLEANKPFLGVPDPITVGSITNGAGWTSASAALGTVFFSGAKRLRTVLTLRITPTGSGNALFQIPLSTGWVITPSSPSGYTDAGVPVTGNLATRPGTAAANYIDLFVTASGTTPFNVSIPFDAVPS